MIEISLIACLLFQIGSLKDMYHFAKHDGDVSVGTLVKELVNGPHNYIAVGLENDPEVINNEYLK